MAYINLSALTHERADVPVVRKISIDDLKTAVRAGFADFRAMPTHVMFLVIIYPIIGLVIARVTMGEDLLPLAYPLMAGFALLGPFAALGLYELSRRREQGRDLFWSHAFDVVRSPSFGAIVMLGTVQMLIFIAWIATAHGLYSGLFGHAARPQSLSELASLVLTTPSGWALIILGNGIGFLFAVLALGLSVVSFPLLLDRPVGAMAAMATSVRAVLANPGPMAAWGLFIAVALFIGSLPLFIGLAIILPILGHATWHLYRRVVVAADPRL
jgi:uncharacterized membrane protein